MKTIEPSTSVVRAPGLRVLLACITIFCAWTWAGEAPIPRLELPKDGKDEKPVESTDAALPDIAWSAARQSLQEEKDALVLAGNAWIKFKNIKLEADSLVIFRATKELYAEGNIRVRMGESEFAAQAAYVDITNETGYLIEAVVRVSAGPTVLEGLGGAQKRPKEEELEREELRQLASDKYSPAYIRTRDPYGIYLDPIDDPQARTNLVFRAEKVVLNGRKNISAEDAYVTVDDMVHPMYGVKVGSLDFTMKEVASEDKPGKTELKPDRMVAKRARINVLGVSFFPFPKISYDLNKKNPFFQLNAGNSDRWGPFVLMRFGFNLGNEGRSSAFNPTHVYLDLDERWKRGPAGGAELNWQTGARPPETGDKQRFERGEGFFRFYVTDEFQTTEKDDLKRARREFERRIQPKIDGFPRRSFDPNLLFSNRRRVQDAGPPSFELDEHRDEFRGLVEFQHHQPLKRFSGIDNLQLDLRYEQHSDRDFNLEYFPQNYLKSNQPEALASLRKPGDNYSIELLYRANPQDFDSAPPRSPVDYGTFSGYEPALTYTLTPTPLPHGFIMSSELQAARLTREFERAIYDQDDFKANRVYGKVDFARPFKWKALNFVPHVGTVQSAYDNSQDGDEVFQGAVTYGFDLTSRIYGTFADFENDALGLRGMRHIIEPRISYSGISDPQEDPEKLLDFDEVDDLENIDKVTFAIDQTFQTKRPTKDGGFKTVNFAGVDMSIDYLPRERDRERLLDGDRYGNFKVDGFLRVVDALKVDASMGVSIEDGTVETASYGVTIDPHTRWRIRFEERYNFEDSKRSIIGSDQFKARLDYKLTDRWSVYYERIYERRKSLLQRKGRQLERIGVTRHYGPLDVTFAYGIDANLGDSSFYVSVRPTATYRNLVVPSQDLLVGAGEVSGEDVAPEEGNFDPFVLMKRKKKRTTPAGTKTDVPPPPPGSPRDQDVPVPPPPAPNKRTDAGKNGEAATFLDPNTPPPPRKRPTRVDEDEWTAPMTTPASTRPQN